METPPIKCCDCDCDCSSQGSWNRSIKRRHDELVVKDQRFSVPELDDLDMFSNPRVHIENECELLRETVTNQQETIQHLYDELEKERNASSSAADGAMGMIQKLTTEKAALQLECTQLERTVNGRVNYENAEIAALEDVVYQRDQIIQSLKFEIQAYKHRLMSYGLTEAEAGGDKSLLTRYPSSLIDTNSEFDFPTYDYPPLKCNINENQDPLEADIYVADDENYPPADSPHGREHLKTLDRRLSQMETNPSFIPLNGDFSGARGRDVSEKVMVGESPRHQRHVRRISPTGSSSHLGTSKELRPDVFVDFPRYESYSSKKVENAENNNHTKDDSSEIGDDMSDRVYTIDSVHHSSVSYSGGVTEQKLEDGTCDSNVVLSREHADLGDPDITKLYMRLQALEADRESMKQALVSMRTEKAQMVLLKEIAQHLSKEVVPQRRLPLRKASIAGPLSFTPVFKWITSFVSWKRKARRSKYMFGMSGNNVGLQMLLEKVPRSQKWRCLLRSTQV
ncbi:PREDICTED: myosin-binding protein 7-like [Camelina sativa]|uniref:Myosin-binding protein 7-like n=1 Tax=Camelina sativa TaxID=90675 RepID=A0ABM0YAL7_CAMSA|nr:PREDICTED: myosin-binding protein 7-like [Camelina sativa]